MEPTAPVIVGGSISLASVLGLLVKLWLGSLDRRQQERDVETKSQLAAIFSELKHLGAHETRLTVLERESQRAEQRIRELELELRGDRTPSGRFRVYVPKGEDE